MTKTLEDYAKNAETRGKALRSVDALLHEVAAAEKRLDKAQFNFNAIEAEAEKEYEEKLTAIRNELNQKARELEDERSKKVNNAKSGLGTAQAERDKVIKKYQVAHQRLLKLLPPEEFEHEDHDTKDQSNNGEVHGKENRSPATVGQRAP